MCNPYTNNKNKYMSFMGYLGCCSFHFITHFIYITYKGCKDKGEIYFDSTLLCF